MVLLAQAWARLEYGDLRETIFDVFSSAKLRGKISFPGPRNVYASKP
jgi:hypothetical protein